MRLGPGLITGASDDDPSGIGTYSQAGAQLGFGIGWTMLLTYPLMAAIQEISARIGRVTGHGIAGNVCRNFPAPVIWSLVLLLFGANTINVAADLGAMADSLKLLIGGPRVFYVVAFGAVSVLAQIFLEYRRYVAILKWLTLALFAYVIALAVVKVPWGQALRGLLVPTIQWNGAFLTTLVAILGATISPYLFIWQSSQEAEEQRIDPDKKPLRIKPKTRGIHPNPHRHARWDGVFQHHCDRDHHHDGRDAACKWQDQYRDVSTGGRSFKAARGSGRGADLCARHHRHWASRDPGACRLDCLRDR